MFNWATKFLLYTGHSEQEEGKGEKLNRAGKKPKTARAGQEVVNSIQFKPVQCNTMQFNLIQQILLPVFSVQSPLGNKMLNTWPTMFQESLSPFL